MSQAVSDSAIRWNNSPKESSKYFTMCRIIGIFAWPYS